MVRMNLWLRGGVAVLGLGLNAAQAQISQQYVPQYNYGAPNYMPRVEAGQMVAPLAPSEPPTALEQARQFGVEPQTGADGNVNGARTTGSPYAYGTAGVDQGDVHGAVGAGVEMGDGSGN